MSPQRLPSSLLLLAFACAAVLLAGCTSLRPGPASPAASDCGLLAAATLPPDYRYPPGDTFSVATWNVEHFVDANDDPYIDNDRENAAPPLAGRDTLFAQVLRALDADVVVLQEFESAPFARVLVDSLVPDLGYRFVAGHESLNWYQNVVVLSRLPLGTLQTFATVVTPIEGTTDDAGRPAATSLINHRLWTTTVQARPGYAFTLVGAHLKAGGGARNAGWRRGQVRLLHSALARERRVCPVANVLIAGDLNMLADSPERTLLLNQDGALGPAQFVDPLEGTGALTHPAEAPERQLDYLLPSETMQPEIVEGSVRVAQPLERAAQARASDHLPVVGRFVAKE